MASTANRTTAEHRPRWRKAPLVVAICLVPILAAAAFSRPATPGGDGTVLHTAAVHTIDWLYQNKHYGPAGTGFLYFQRLAPHHRLAGKALFLAGQCAMKQERYDLAADRFGEVVTGYRADTDLCAEALYWQAICVYRCANYQACHRLIAQITTDYPTSKWATYCRRVRPHYIRIDSEPGTEPQGGGAQ